MKYKEVVIKSMEYLADQENTIFLGQNIRYGSQMYETLLTIPDYKKIEMPIAEDMQMGIAIGLALNGYLPICIYERMDFLILAINQLVNHLDKARKMSRGEFDPKVIIRTIIGSKEPLYPGLQHSQDHTDMLKACLTNIDIIKLEKTSNIFNEYQKAVKSNKSTIIIETKDLYNLEVIF